MNQLAMRLAALSLGAIAAVVLVPDTSAFATPTSATGGFVVTSDTQIPTRFPAANLVLAETSGLQYSGDLSGTAADTDTFVVHANGTFEGHGTEACNPCTLWGHTGSFTSTFTFNGSGDTYTGQLTITGSAGGLTGLHGTGTFNGLIAENLNSYAYNLQLD